MSRSHASTPPPSCAAARAHYLLRTYAARILRVGCEDIQRRGVFATGQVRIELASDLLSLTTRLFRVLHCRAPDDQTWKPWLAMVRDVAGVDHWPNDPSAHELRARILLERILIVRWGDAGAMLVSPLPRLSAEQTLVVRRYVETKRDEEVQP